MMSKNKVAPNIGLDYEKELIVFQNNLNNAIRAFYYDVALYERVKDNTKEICLLNETPWFWNDFRHYTVMSVFIVLGRIFDKDTRSHSIDRLEQAARTTDYFCKENLRLRKVSSSDNSSEWIDGYMEGVYELIDADFDRMGSFIEEIRTDWNKLEKVRHKFFAHQDMFSDENVKKELLEKADNKLIESVIKKLLTVESILLEAGLNGKKPDYDYAPEQMRAIAKKELNKVIDLLSTGSAQVIGD